MEIIEEIKKEIDIEDKFINGKPMDKEKRLFISDNFVIKIYYPNKFHYYTNELEIYKGLQNADYIPRLISYREKGNYKYIILSRLKGIQLFNVWSKLTNTEKKDILKQLAIILKDINSIKTNQLNFQKTMTDQFNFSVGKLNFSDQTINCIRSIFEDNISYIDKEEKTNLIHIDTHFYNFMLEGNKLYAYDFENTIEAPKDYQLVRLYRMNYYPNSFIYPHNSLSPEEVKEYNCIIPEIINNYKTLIDNEYVENRLKIYLLNYLLQEVNRCHISEEKTISIIDENRKIKLRR